MDTLYNLCKQLYQEREHNDRSDKEVECLHIITALAYQTYTLFDDWQWTLV